MKKKEIKKIIEEVQRQVIINKIVKLVEEVDDDNFIFPDDLDKIKPIN